MAAAPQFKLFNTDGAGIDNLNALVQFVNYLARLFWSTYNGPGSVVVVGGNSIYNANPQDRVVSINNTIAAPITVNLPLLPFTGETHTFKDSSGTGGTYNDTIQGGGLLIDGAADYVINFNYGAVTVSFDGTRWNAIA